MANENKGAFFINEKRPNENYPSYTGTCTIEGNEYKVAIWPKTSNAGKRFWSMAFTLKQPDPGAPPPPEAQKETIDPFSEELPF